MVAIDTPFIDHPAGHLHGPASRRPAHEAPRRRVQGGHRPGLPRKSIREWNIAHKTILGAGIPTIEQVGGDVDDVKGKRATLAATPWKFEHGDACQVRMVAMFDPSGKLPHRAGQVMSRGDERTTDMSLKVYDLTHTFTQFMPGVAVDPEREHRRQQVPRQGRHLRDAVGRHHAPLHPHGRSSARDREHPHHQRLPAVAPVRHRRVRSTSPRRSGASSPPEDLENATPKIQEGDIVIINTGFHHMWADTDEYFAYGPGIGEEGAQWLVDKKVKMVGYGCQANDHPHRHQARQPRARPHTAAPHRRVQADHRPRPQGGLPRVGARAQDPHGARAASPASRTSAATWTRSPASAAPSWRCPWRWPGGDGCIVRMLAITDPDQTFRFETGQ